MRDYTFSIRSTKNYLLETLVVGKDGALVFFIVYHSLFLILLSFQMVLGDDEGIGDVVADVVNTHQAVKAILFEDGTHALVHTRKDDGDAVAVTLFDEVSEVVKTCGIDEWYLAHSDDTNLWFCLHAVHDVLELVSNTEEIRTIDFIDFHTFRDVEVIHAEIGKFGVFRWVDFLSKVSTLT